MEVTKHILPYKEENISIVEHFDSIVFTDSYYACDPGIRKHYPGYGEYLSNERNFYIYEIFPTKDLEQNKNDLNFLKSKIPLFFEIIEKFCASKEKNAQLNRLCIIAYKDHTNFVTEHVHNPPHNDYIAIYYPSDANHGTEIWHENKWQILDNLSGNMFIIPANMLHRFHMQHSDTKRMMIAANISALPVKNTEMIAGYK